MGDDQDESRREELDPYAWVWPVVTELGSEFPYLSDPRVILYEQPFTWTLRMALELRKRRKREAYAKRREIALAARANGAAFAGGKGSQAFLKELEEPSPDERSGGERERFQDLSMFSSVPGQVLTVKIRKKDA